MDSDSLEAKLKRKAYNKAYYLANIERLRAISKEYYRRKSAEDPTVREYHRLKSRRRHSKMK